MSIFQERLLEAAVFLRDNPVTEAKIKDEIIEMFTEDCLTTEEQGRINIGRVTKEESIEYYERYQKWASEFQSLIVQKISPESIN